jgi:predicted RNA-binding Zn ribbon-like protein
MTSAHTEWAAEHFIGGHPALDLANAVFDRRAPIADNELLKSARDVGNWLRATRLVGERQAAAVARIAGGRFLACVHEVREASFRIFDAIAANRAPPAEALGILFSRAQGGLASETVELRDTRPELTLAQWRNPDAVAAFLAMLSIEAFFTLPRERFHACPRCGWLFVDTSRGGKRRWCSMQTCGNREKVSRHRKHADV